MLEILGLGSDHDAAAAAAEATGGTLYVNHPDEHPKRPYSTMIRASTDDLELLRDAADVGLYVSFARAIKPEPDRLPPERAIASFAMVGHPSLDHRQADAHWRDIHAPLALRSHSAMCDYTQLSVVATLSGVPIDGMAMCSFETRQDLSQRFFNDEQAEADVQADVSQFADFSKSLRRVVLNQVT